MSLIIPGLQGLFSHMQEYPHRVLKKRVNLPQIINEAREDFRWLDMDIDNHPMRIYKLTPPTYTLDRYHDDSSYTCGGVNLPGSDPFIRVLKMQPSATLTSTEPSANNYIIRKANFPADVVRDIVYWENPQGRIANSDLKLVGSILYHEYVANCFGIREQITLS